MATPTDRHDFMVRLPKEQHEQLQRIAAVEDRSMASVVRLALRDYLEKKQEQSTQVAV